MFGLSREWLLHEGRVVPTALVLSHDEQYVRLAKNCPEALTAALVAGDPCYDRLTASLPHRSRYRKALGLRPGQQLVLISSTWGTASLFGRHPHLARRLLGSLPSDEYRVALALHPNIWHGHGPGQVEAWLADAVRAGLLVLPPNQGWQAAVVAADAVLGDHGSVAYYAAALGRPVVLVRAGRDLVDSASPIAELLDTAVSYELGTPVEDALASAHHAQERTTRVARASVSSRPGRSLALIRQAMYRLMDAEEPAGPPLVEAVPDPVPRPVPPHPALSVTVSRGPTNEYRLRRVPAAALTRTGDQNGGEAGFLMVWESETDSRLSELADVVVCPSADLPEDGDEWCRNVFRHRAGPRTAAYYDADGCVLHVRSGHEFVCTVERSEGAFDPELLVAVLHHRLVRTAGATTPLEQRTTLRIRAGSDATATVTITARRPGPQGIRKGPAR
ncbi:hypothetical protein ACFXKD_13500 [Nocardiopsis aegyptia]|uniref:hypothetical protein n=1 Tax=Nocardiopsis aegyptia TaxID=220378 RepID=UPI00366C479E